MHIITCEQVSCGHPDKICDQIADAIVTDCLRHDPESRCAVEMLIKNADIVVAGEVTSAHTPDMKKLAVDVLQRIGVENVGQYRVTNWLGKQSPDIALGVDSGGAGDQGIMFGYATNETPELMPIPFAVATYALELLREWVGPMIRPDAKSQVSYDYDSGKITTFLISTQHGEEYTVDDIRPIVESVMERAAMHYGLNTDFERLVNPTGRFVIGGSFADCGVTGRKLACDTYGGVGHIGGGALSGKDPTKVDRSAAYMARKIARDIVSAGMSDRCEVQLAYAIGVAEPVSVSVECFGGEKFPAAEIESFIRKSYDLTPQGIIRLLDLTNVDYNLVSSYGHLGKPELPWER